MNIPKLLWSEERQPNEHVPYNHVTANTPFGRFLITWKGWKKWSDPTIDETPWGVFGGIGTSLEEAKEIAEKEYHRRLIDAITQSPGEPPTDPVSGDENPNNQTGKHSSGVKPCGSPDIMEKEAIELIEKFPRRLK